MIYKYRSFESIYKYDVFTQSELYFASPSEFNDPFESKPKVVGLDTLKERQEHVESYIKRDLPNLKHKEKKDLKKKLLIRLSNLELVTNDLHEMLSKYGVFSSAENWNQILMWSHYSDSHKGFCIGFEFDDIFDRDMGMAHNVKYKNNYPKLSPLLLNRDITGNNEKLVETTIATKSSEWSYEREVRYIKLSREGGNGIYKFNGEKVKELILGASATKNNKNKLIDIVKIHMPWVDVYQATISPTKYELHRELIS